MNGPRYVELFQEKLQMHMYIHTCTIILFDAAVMPQVKCHSGYFEQDQRDDTDLTAEQARSETK